MSDKDFFIGWAETSSSDRRFFLKSGISLIAATGALGVGLAAFQNPVGTGKWDQGDVREWRGIVTGEPYAMLRTHDLGAGIKTALLACLGKCGVSARIGQHAGKPVIIKGSLITRKGHAMIAVSDGADWIREDISTPSQPDLKFSLPTPVDEVSLVGEILDTKCWFGAMRPSEGKVHKACAALCIRGGLPPAFFAKDDKGNKILLIMTDNYSAHSHDLLPFVADPVQISGQIYRRDDLLFLDSSPQSIVRL